jgi:hypothetical protein
MSAWHEKESMSPVCSALVDNFQPDDEDKHLYKSQNRKTLTLPKLLVLSVGQFTS